MCNKLKLPRTHTSLSVNLLLSCSAQAFKTSSSSVQQPSNSSTSQETTVVE
ncbi:acetoacetate decarboxylase, partial [Acinetobacter baumannii]